MTPRRFLFDHEAASPLEARLQQMGLGLLRFLGNRLAVVGAGVILLLVLTAIFASLLAPHDPNAQDLANTLAPPSWDHWGGTDEYGRDIFSRVVFGARISLYIIALVTLVVGPVGLLVGTVAGYCGGSVDLLLMRITDLFLSFPSLILTLAVVAALGPSLDNAVIAIGLTAWPPIARLARAEALIYRSSDFVAAARLQGASAARVVLFHIVPMCLSSVVIRLTFNMAAVLLTAAGLGFLGLGAQPPTPEWGAMISAGRRYMLESWWVVTFPGMAILIVSLAFNLFGDGLRDILDPKQD